MLAALRAWFRTDGLWVQPRPADLVAGFSVALVLIPQSLAYAEIAGMPAAAGLLASALPPIVAATVASSPQLQTGPVAVTSLLTFGALSTRADPGSADYIALAAVLAVVVGVVRMVIGLARLGKIAYAMTQPVVIGFTAAAAVTIIASQIPKAVGSDADGSVLVRALRAVGDPGGWRWSSVGLAVLTMAIVIGMRRVHALVPGVLIAVIVATIVANLAGYDGDTVGDISGVFPTLELDLPWGSTWSLLVSGVVIALVGFAEPSAIARTYARADVVRWSSNREFISQGLANVTAGVTGGFPVGGSFSRSSINRMSGARTRWSGAITGLVVLVALPFLSVLEDLPQAVLAGLVIAGVYRLFDLGALWSLRDPSLVQGLIAWITFAATLLFAPRVEWGVVLGVVLAGVARFGYGAASIHGLTDADRDEAATEAAAKVR